jgi:Short-chain alcohol dehydrogenase of unknown specificity
MGSNETLKSLSGRVAVVTGGASGAGAAICREFVKRGAFVFVADIDLANAQKMALELGPDSCLYVPTPMPTTVGKTASH